MDDNQKLTLHPQRAEEITDNRRCRLTTITPTFSPRLSRHVVGVVHIAVALAFTVTLCVLFVDRPVTSYFSRHTNLLRVISIFCGPVLAYGPGSGTFSCLRCRTVASWRSQGEPDMAYDEPGKNGRRCDQERVAISVRQTVARYMAAIGCLSVSSFH